MVRNGALCWRGADMAFGQQLVARIKRSSKYYGQTVAGEWFEVRVVSNTSDYPLRGNNNNYRMSDVVFGIRLEDGTIADLSNGKRSGGVSQ